jgi:hypothetical protein
MIGPHTLLTKIGAGGIATVHLARPSTIGCAIGQTDDDGMAEFVCDGCLPCQQGA